MGTAYTKTSPTNFVDGETIEASDFTTEFNAIDATFETGGHQHDGTDGEGGAIEKLLSNSITFGTGADTDIVVTFNANTSDGVLTWMEDEDYFKFNDKIMLIDDTTLIFGSDSNWTIEYDENGDDDLVLTGSDMVIESSTSAKPVLTITNTNADANSATLKFNKNGSSPATSDVIGNIDFLSEDAGNAATTYGRIQSTIVDVTAGGEQGGIDFYVAEYDGTLTKGMAIAGAASDGDITVDVSTHDGASGGLKLGGTLLTSTATELNLLDGVTAGTAAASKAVVLDSNKDIGTIRNITSNGTIQFGSISDGTITATAFVDEDDMSSNSATLIPTQQSVKAYADSVGGMSSFQLEDDDGTEVTIDNAKEVKIIGSGVTTNWTDTSSGTDGDPYDLTITVDAAQTGITSLLATDIKIGEDDQTKIDFETADTINFYAGNEKQLILTDGALTPGSNAIIDLGTDALEFKDAYFDGTVEADAITIGGTAIGSIYLTTAQVQAEATALAIALG